MKVREQACQSQCLVRPWLLAHHLHGTLQTTHQGDRSLYNRVAVPSLLSSLLSHLLCPRKQTYAHAPSYL